MRPRVSAAFFDDLYAKNMDPWEFETSEYERAKYDATVEALDGRHFESGLELGCAIGVLTQWLAPHCDRMLGVDVAEAALVKARERNPDVTFERREIPEEYPEGHFDLTVASEVLYYLDPPAFQATLDKLTGTLIAVHWRPPTQNYPFGGDNVHDELADRFGKPDFSKRTDKYILERWDRCDS